MSAAKNTLECVARIACEYALIVTIKLAELAIRNVQKRAAARFMRARPGAICSARNFSGIAPPARLISDITYQFNRLKPLSQIGPFKRPKTSRPSSHCLINAKTGSNLPKNSSTIWAECSVHT